MVIKIEMEFCFIYFSSIFISKYEEPCPRVNPLRNGRAIAV